MQADSMYSRLGSSASSEADHDYNHLNEPDTYSRLNTAKVSFFSPLASFA
eukprot:m.178543 g.178543  ORF g.178543 m.178543 type:complete len:50 (-) comp53391_c0_seq18:148-297(-)